MRRHRAQDAPAGILPGIGNRENEGQHQNDPQPKRIAFRQPGFGQADLKARQGKSHALPVRPPEFGLGGAQRRFGRAIVENGQRPVSESGFPFDPAFRGATSGPTDFGPGAVKRGKKCDGESNQHAGMKCRRQGGQ